MFIVLLVKWLVTVLMLWQNNAGAVINVVIIVVKWCRVDGNVNGMDGIGCVVV